MKKYLIEFSDTLEDLCAGVEDCLMCGWELHGQPFIGKGKRYDSETDQTEEIEGFFQAMIHNG